MSDLCCHIDYEPWSRRVALCDKPAKVIRNGQWFCGEHDPMRLERAADAVLEVCESMDAKRAEIERRAACFDDLVAALLVAERAIIDGIEEKTGREFRAGDEIKAIWVAHAALKKAKGE